MHFLHPMHLSGSTFDFPLFGLNRTTHGDLKIIALTPGSSAMRRISGMQVLRSSGSIVSTVARPIPRRTSSMRTA